MNTFRDASGVRRIISAAIIGVVTGAGTALAAPWQGATLLGWDVIAAVILIGAWSAIRHYDATETRAHATKSDNSRAASHALLVAASLASLVGIAILLVKAKNESGVQRFSLSALAVATVAVSWLLVHTTYTLRYAHQYYSETVGGVDFPGTRHTDASYRDFAYLAFTVGMTFQVSDTEITHQAIRRTVFGHALLSYLFGAVIVAVTVNVIAGIVN